MPQINRPNSPVPLINKWENAFRWLCFCLCPRVYTFETHVWDGGSRENQTFGYEVTWQVARWWQRASFPPNDENHVSGATHAEEGMVSENTSTAASYQQLDDHLSCPWSCLFFLCPYYRFLNSITFLFSCLHLLFLYSIVHTHTHCLVASCVCPYGKLKAGQGEPG